MNLQPISLWAWVQGNIHPLTDLWESWEAPCARCLFRQMEKVHEKALFEAGVRNLPRSFYDLSYLV